MFIHFYFFHIIYKQNQKSIDIPKMCLHYLQIYFFPIFLKILVYYFHLKKIIRYIFLLTKDNEMTMPNDENLLKKFLKIKLKISYRKTLILIKISFLLVFHFLLYESIKNHSRIIPYFQMANQELI